MRGFWSYARHDVEADGSPLEEIRCYLERQIGRRLGLRRDFPLWRDRINLEAGQQWRDEIEQRLGEANVLIVLLTPNWLASNHCRKELATFTDGVASSVSPRFVVPVYFRRSPILEGEESAGAPDAQAAIKTLKSLHRANWTSIADAIEDDGLRSPMVKAKVRDLAESISHSLRPQGSSQAPVIPLPTTPTGSATRRVVVSSGEISRPKGPGRIELDQGPNTVSTDRFLVRPDAVFATTEVITSKFVFPVALKQARMRVDVVGGVVDLDTIAGRPEIELANGRVGYLGAQEWRIAALGETPLAGSVMLDGGLCAVSAAATESGVRVSLVATPQDFAVREQDARLRDDTTNVGDRMFSLFGVNGRKLVKIWLQERLVQQFERDDDDVLLCEATLMTRAMP